MIQIQKKLIWINLKAIGGSVINFMQSKVEDFEKMEMKPMIVISENVLTT
jgi:hypothetical protein